MAKERNRFSSLSPDEPVRILKSLDRYSPGLHPLRFGGVLAGRLKREHVAEQLGLIELASDFVEFQVEYYSQGIRRLCEIFPTFEGFIKDIISERVERNFIEIDEKVKQWLEDNTVNLPELYRGDEV